MSVAMVETGGDPGHAPARRTYEKAGFGLFPTARYFNLSRNFSVVRPRKGDLQSVLGCVVGRSQPV
jgi:hypothetical protein